MPEIDAAVDCWGGAVVPDERFPKATIMSPFGATSEIHALLSGIFGNDDQFPPPAEVDKIEEELKKNGKEYEFHRYDGATHGFWAYDRASYNPLATNDSFQKVLPSTTNI